MGCSILSPSTFSVWEGICFNIVLISSTSLKSRENSFSGYILFNDASIILLSFDASSFFIYIYILKKKKWKIRITIKIII